MGLEETDAQFGSERVLALIKRRGPQRATDVALALGITAEAARQQIVRLAGRELLAPRAQQHGRGRPAQAWDLTDAGHARFPDRHAEVTVRLIDAVRTAFGEAALDGLIAQRETETQRAYAAALRGATSLAARVGRLAAARTREGYMAEFERAPDGFVLIENHCPICAAAAACQGFCRSELDVFRAVLGDDVTVERTDHILAGARRCAYLIAPRKKAKPHAVDRRPRVGRTQDRR